MKFLLGLMLMLQVAIGTVSYHFYKQHQDGITRVKQLEKDLGKLILVIKDHNYILNSLVDFHISPSKIKGK